MDKEKLEVNCPTCKKLFHYYKSEFRPFCSKRCKEVDLGAWLTESYFVEGEHTYFEEESLEDETKTH